MSDIQKSNIRFLLRFLDEAIKCGEISGDRKKHIMENNDLNEFFQEEHDVRDELVETLQATLNPFTPNIHNTNHIFHNFLNSMNPKCSFTRYT